MISTGTLFVAGINGVKSYLTGTEFGFAWYYPFSIILLGILCAVPTALFILDAEGRKDITRCSLILHFLSEWAVTAMMGWVFRWYASSLQLLEISMDFVAVYIFVWTSTLWLFRQEDKKINRALKDIQDDE